MKAVFLDRDGTVTVEKGYVTVPEAIEPIPGAAEAIAALRAKDWKVFIVTNQSPVAKGLITEDELEAIHQRMVMMLGAEGGMLDGVYYCPHNPDGSEPQYAEECGCRKPRAGMLERAAGEHGLELSECIMVGDALRDLQAGRAAGTAANVLVLTGHGQKTSKEDHGADHVAADLPAAVEWILSRG